MGEGSGGADWWFTHINGVQAGPFDQQEVQRQFLNGSLKPADGVWCAGWPNWQSAGSVFQNLIVPPPIQQFMASQTHAPEPQTMEQVKIDPRSRDVGSVKIGRRQIHIHRFTGVVVDLQRSSRTHVSGGQNNTPITTHTVNIQNVFVRLADGSERTFDAEPAGVPVRAGNTLTFLLGIVDGKQTGYYTTLWNHEVGQMGHLEPGIEKLAGPWWRYLGHVFVAITILLGIFLILSLSQKPGDVPALAKTFIATMSAFVFVAFVTDQRQKKLRAAMENAISDLRK